MRRKFLPALPPKKYYPVALNEEEYNYLLLYLEILQDEPTKLETALLNKMKGTAGVTTRTTFSVGQLLRPEVINPWKDTGRGKTCVCGSGEKY